MSFVFNVGRGRLQQLIDMGATIKMLILKAAATASVLEDLETVAEVLANGSTNEADFTNYARKTLSLTKNVNNTSDRVELSFDEVVFTEAGGETNNTTVLAVIYIQGPSGDSDSTPLVALDAVFTTDGNDVKLNSPSGGFYQSGKAS